MTTKSKSNGNGRKVNDALLKKAIALTRAEGKISVSMLRDRLKVGYAQAGQLLQALEERGLIETGNEGTGANVQTL